jgi:hypothetical protein
VSNRYTGCPAFATTWAMPLPIAPAPITATIVDDGSAEELVLVMVIVF